MWKMYSTQGLCCKKWWTQNVCFTFIKSFCIICLFCDVVWWSLKATVGVPYNSCRPAAAAYCVVSVRHSSSIFQDEKINLFTPIKLSEKNKTKTCWRLCSCILPFLLCLRHFSESLQRSLFQHFKKQNQRKQILWKVFYVCIFGVWVLPHFVAFSFTNYFL